jgi:uncharacterized protein (TIGR02118 family)
MFNISFLYEKKKGSVFNEDYFINVHIPMALKLLSNKRGFKGISVEVGLDIKELNLASPFLASPFIAICQYYYDTIENFMNEYSYHENKISDDLVNYSDIKPIIQISQIKIIKV